MDDEKKLNVDDKDVNQTESTVVTGLYRFNFLFMNGINQKQNCERLYRSITVMCFYVLSGRNKSLSLYV